MRTSTQTIKAVVFDMGNVVLKVDHMIACDKFAQFSNFQKEKIFENMVGTKLEDRFERGMMTPQSFYESTIAKIGVNISFDVFSEIFNDVFCTNPGMSEIIGQLKKDLKIMLLSNTNALHFSWVDQKFDVLKNFKQRVLSYQVGARKPEKEIFLHALHLLGCRPEEVLYVDDLIPFVRASRQLGMHAILFRSFSSFHSELLQYI
jgi:glucose-1-phosphatase